MIPYIPEKFNSRRIEYLREYEGGYGNMARETRFFSEVVAGDFPDDRLHRPDDRLCNSELPSSLCMNIDFMVMKTVVTEIFCAIHE